MKRDEYSKKHIDFTINFLKKIVDTDINVKIVSGIFDDICKRCSRKGKIHIGCYGDEDDVKVILETEFQENEVYKSKDILKELRKVR